MSIYYPPNAAHFDGNQVPTMMGVEGTLGTADTSGTAAPLPVGVDPATGAAYVYNLGPAGSVSLGNITGGTINQIGTVLGIGGTVQVSGASAGTNVNIVTGTFNAGTVTVSGGTFNAGTFTNSGTNVNIVTGTVNSIPNIPGGTINVATIAGNIGTVSMLSAGTITTLPNIPGGTVGSVTGIGVVSNLTNGSIVVTTGTVVNNGGSAIAYGPAAAAAAAAGNPLNVGGTDSGGTIRTIKVDSGGLQRVGIDSGTISVLPNLPQGSINVTAGTVTATMTVGTVNTGTINTGTINTGTFTANGGTIAQITNGSIIVTAGSIVGTQQINPLPAVNTISHAGTSGTTAIGTLVGTASIGSGTAAYITAFHILAISGTPEVTLAFGSVTNGNQVIAHGLFPAGGGITESIHYPHGYGTTNSPITYQINSGAGTVEWSVDYFPHT